ncbi:MAG: flagellar hook-associated protein FlgK [Sphingomonadales bacterium]
MTDLLSLGAAGIRSYSRALSTVSDNIANAQTAGYARRTAVITEQPSSGNGILYQSQVNPGGSLATGVTRSVDPWLIEDARTSSSDAGRTGAKLNWLENTESALANGGAGVGTAMTGVFNRADELAADPTNTARRSAFLDSINTVASTFRTTADGLTRAADGVATAAKLTVAQVNTDVEALGRVNEGLRRARDGSTNQASLLDERDRLINSIATSVPVSVEYDAKGAAKISVGSQPLLDGATQTRLSMAVATDGRLSLVAAGSTSSTVVAVTSGTIAGQIDGADHIATMRTAVDTQANAFAAQVNAQQAAGRDAAGNPGAPLFTIGSGAADLVANAMAPSGVAAADATSSNGNALAFGNLRGASDGEAKWATLIAQQSQTVSSTRAQDTVTTARRDGAAEARDNLSAVDLDREAGDLLRYQQAYDAAARVMQVARETMQSIMNAL